ncbi:MAG: C40 family peptidase [Actinomycetota bacterium]|nr:C40 family peptidase [Actinomycetota bacterium]
MPSSARTALAAAVATALTAALTVSVAGTASADVHHPYPSRRQVAQAQSNVLSRSRDVSSIRAQLVLANAQLQATSNRAEIASENYNGALWRLSLAKQAARKAARSAAAARGRVAQQRNGIAALVTRSYQEGTQINAMNAILGSSGPTGLMSRVGVIQSAGDSMQARFDRFQALNTLAKVYQVKAESSRAHQQQLAVDAKKARDEAASMANAAQAAASQIAAQKQQLVVALASAQHISVGLATKRQAALEEIARQKAAQAAAAQAQAQALAQAQAQAQARASAQALADAKAKAGQQAPQPKRAQQPKQAKNNHHSQQPPASPPPAPPVSTVPPPIVGPTPPPASGGAGRAIAFARAQLGEPYQWGAAGPSSWDCSGLTMMAWRAGGVSLAHYTVAQYEETTRISVGTLRPGDLLFWGATNNPGSIHHVAMYLGNGMMIQAPHTGAHVEVVSMYSWQPPNYFGRV